MLNDSLKLTLKAPGSEEGLLEETVRVNMSLWAGTEALQGSHKGMREKGRRWSRPGEMWQDLLLFLEKTLGQGGRHGKSILMGAVCPVRRPFSISVCSGGLGMILHGSIWGPRT